LAALPFATVLVATLGRNLAALLQQLGDLSAARILLDASDRIGK